jgi:hypothetical protein
LTKGGIEEKYISKNYLKLQKYGSNLKNKENNEDEIERKI